MQDSAYEIKLLTGLGMTFYNLDNSNIITGVSINANFNQITKPKNRF
jgi:hypothetical protein